MPPHQPIVVALAGNPNSGKTTIFNNITGARQHVGNYPGVTVEKKEGVCTFDGTSMRFVDLPGAYSLTAYSIEEIIARNFVVEEKPDVVVDVVDASNLERNLYLLAQFIEMGAPLVVALNMMDVAESRGIKIDVARLSELLGCPVAPTVGSRNEGTNDLLAAVKKVAEEGKRSDPLRVRYGREIEDEIERITALLEQEPALLALRPARWTAVKLLETDADVRELVRRTCADPDRLLDRVAQSVGHLERVLGEDAESAITDQRYGFARGVAAAAVTEEAEDRLTRSDRLDQILCNRVIGLPLFALAMYVVFQLVFSLGELPMEWINSFFRWAAAAISAAWPAGQAEALRSLIVDGVIGGVGGVLVFLPNILLLFLAIALLEDSGYMARAAFIVDRLMHKLGLHGKSFIPMLIGFGCSVPGIMATRTLDNKRDRLTTLLVLPLMSCGARLPIYALIIPAFFPPAWRGEVLFLIYFIGIALAVLCARLLRSTLFKGEPVPFVMELPPYRLPTLRGIVIHMWERSWLYLKKAGTIILTVSIVLWALTSYPKKPGIDAEYDAARKQARADLLRLSWRFNLGDLPDPEALCARLRAASDDPTPCPARRVWRLLNERARRALASPDASEEQRRRALLEALNSLLSRPDLYAPESFRETLLEQDARAMLAAGLASHSEPRVRQFNRRLLAAAFPQLIDLGPTTDLERIAAQIGLPGRGRLLMTALRVGPPPPSPNADDRLVRAAADAFAAMVKQVQQARDRVGKPEQKTAAAYLALTRRRDETLAALKTKAPRMFEAAVACIEQALAPFHRRLLAIERARAAEQLKYTAAGRLGRALEPALRPLGFDWRIGTALIGAFAAKEVFVAQLGIVFSLGDSEEGGESLRAALRQSYNRLQAFCIMLFCLIAAPCMATVAITRRETNSWFWALFQFAGLTALGYVVTLIVYQTGSFLHVGV